MSADHVSALCEIAERESDARRLILFVAVATVNDVWPMKRFLDEPQSETEAQASEMFHRVIRSIPEPERVKVWSEVDSILRGRAAH